MIAPSRGLLVLVGVALVPALTIAGTAGSAREVAWVVALALTVVAVADAALSLERLSLIDVTLPSTIHAIVGREAAIGAALRLRGGRGRSLRIALAVPDAVAPEACSAEVLAPAGESSVELRARPLERGLHHATALHVETRSGLGLWSIRRRDAVDVEIRTYPELLFDQKKVASALPRGQEGGWAARQLGRGRDFDRLREYVPGDPSDDIHWRATAKRRRPVTKLFQVERAQEVYVVVDTSRLSTRPVPAGAGWADHTTALVERYIVAALLLGAAAERLGDLFGLATFSDDVHAFIRASKGRGHFRSCREAAVTVVARPVSPDFRQMFSFLGERVRRRSLVYVLTSLDDPAVAEEFAEGASLVAKRHLVVAATRLGPGVRPLFSGDPVASVDDVYDRLEGHLTWKRYRLLRRSLEKRGVGLVSFDNESLVPALVRSYLSLKGRQVL